MAQQTASVPLGDAAVIDAKPLRTLTPMFPAPLGLHTFTPQNSPSFICVTPFGPYAGGTESGTAAVPSMFAAPTPAAEPSQTQLHMANMNGAAQVNGTAVNNLVTPLQTPPSAGVQESGKRKRGRPKRVPDATVPSAPLAPTVPSVTSLPLVPSAPKEGDNIVSVMPSPATPQESGKRKR